MNKVSSNLKHFRRKEKLTQEELANILDVTRQTIHAIETGKYQPSLAVALKAANHFRVNLEKIFTLK